MPVLDRAAGLWGKGRGAGGYVPLYAFLSQTGQQGLHMPVAVANTTGSLMLLKVEQHKSSRDVGSNNRQVPGPAVMYAACMAMASPAVSQSGPQSESCL